MAIRGFSQLASMLNERQLILREVACLSRKEQISGADILSGNNLACICLHFDAYQTHFVSLGASDEIEISERLLASGWVPHPISGAAPWKQIIGSVLVNAWQLSNSKGYDDCVCLEFQISGAQTVRVLLESAASQLRVFNVTPVHPTSAA